VIERTSKIGDETFHTLLDGGAELNFVTVEAAKRIPGDRISVSFSLEGVDNESSTKEAIRTMIKLGSIHANIIVYVVRKAPAEIILGAPFLSQFSKGLP